MAGESNSSDVRQRQGTQPGDELESVEHGCRRKVCTDYEPNEFDALIQELINEGEDPEEILMEKLDRAYDRLDHSVAYGEGPYAE